MVELSPKQWPNHFNILFSRKVSTGFTWASFLMSPFLMWSNLVFHLAHLNILISAELSLFSSFFFFTAQHSQPYVIAGLINVLKTLSFNSTGIVLSHITPDTSFHFIHSIIVLLLTSTCEPPSLVDSDPRYLKDVTVGSSASTIFTVVSVSFVGLGKYSVFVLLIFSPCLSNTTLHVSRSSSTSSRVMAHSTRSSANIIAQGWSFSMVYVRTSGGSWGLGALGPAILWGPQQYWEPMFASWWGAGNPRRGPGQSPGGKRILATTYWKLAENQISWSPSTPKIPIW